MNGDGKHVFILTKKITLALMVTTLCGLFIGCGSESVELHGRLYVDQQPLQLKGKQVVKLALRPENQASHGSEEDSDAPSQTSLPAVSVDDEGRFMVPSVAPGKYHVLVSDFKRYPSGDRLAEHFREAPQSVPLEVSPDSESAEVAIRLKQEWFREVR